MALRAAEAGVDDLPDDASFNDGDSDAHYGLAWWTVEYVADAYGETVAAASGRDGRAVRPRRGPARPVRHGTEDLAGQAERMILALYARGSSYR